jgi:hypothetical protein
MESDAERAEWRDLLFKLEQGEGMGYAPMAPLSTLTWRKSENMRAS